MIKTKFNFSERLLHFSQLMYFTFSNFVSNNLWESASSCSFGFVFSFVPVSLIILTLLTTIIRIVPEIETYILNYAAQFYSVIDVEFALSNITKLQTIHLFDIFLGLWLIWMARKLFSSIVSAMNRIFRSISRRKTTINQLVTFFSEFFLIIVIVLVIIASFTMNKILKFPVFEPFIQMSPLFFNQLSNFVFSFAVYLLLFIVTLYYYKIGSGTKPKWRICIFYSFLNTLSAFIFSFFLNHFITFANYNVIYGTISALIIMMLKVYFFFVIFLFFAQMIYASQFFDTLLLKELYLLPDFYENKLFKNLKRILFINPISNETSENSLYYNGGDVIFTPEEESDCVYYICQGFVKLSYENTTRLINLGSFIGDSSCILGKERGQTAIAFTQCKLIKISRKDFMSVLHENSQAASKAMEKL